MVRTTRASTSAAQRTAPVVESQTATIVTKTEAASPSLDSPKKARKVVKKVVAKVKTEVQVEEEVIVTAKKNARKRKQIKDEDQVNEDQILDEEEASKPAPKKRKTAKAKVEEDGEEKPTAAPKPKRKTKAEKDAEENKILAPRTSVPSDLKGKSMFIGAHVSGAGGIQNSVHNALKIGANSFALFLKSQRKWESPPLADENRDAFREKIGELGYLADKHVLPHGSYLVNLAQKEKDKADQAYESFIDDLRRCDALGIRLYNFHPGSTGGDTKEAAIGRIAAQLNRSHRETSEVVTVLECMCGSGNVIGSTFEELRDIIALVEDKSRVGVCIDTCHAFAAGYDLRTPEAFDETVRKFDEVVGVGYLKAIHLNDSKAPFNSHRDLHANIGTGFLGLRAFHSVMNYAGFQNMPIVLETPIEVKGPDGKMIEDKQIWADEIKLLESLVDMDPESPEFVKKEEELQAKGASERAKIQEQVDKKAEKDAAKAAKDAAKEAKKGDKGMMEKFLTKAKKKKEPVKQESCDSCGEGESDEE